MKILLWVLCTSILIVLVNGPSYWWLPSGFVLLLFILDTIDEMAKDSSEG